jgi:hypothetical protein
LNQGASLAWNVPTTSASDSESDSSQLELLPELAPVCRPEVVFAKGVVHSGESDERRRRALQLGSVLPNLHPFGLEGKMSFEIKQMDRNHVQSCPKYIYGQKKQKIIKTV